MASTDIGARLARWTRTGDPHDLWPGLREADFRSAMIEIGRVTRSALQEPDPAEPVACAYAGPPSTLGVAAFASGMGPLLGYWAETGRLRVDPPLAAVLAEHLAHGRARVGRLDAALGSVLDAFAAHGISVAVLKSMHTAWTYFPDPGTRPGSDIDLLIAPSDLGLASTVLTGMGFRPQHATADGSRGDWFPPGAPAEPASLDVTHPDNPWHVDLHVSLDRTLRFGLRPHFGSPAPANGPRQERAGRAFHVVPQPLLLAWLAVHAAGHLENGPMIRYAELALVIRRDFKPASDLWEEFLNLASGTGADFLGYPALELAERLVPGSVPPAVRRALRRSAPWMVRRVVSRLRPETSQQLYRLTVDVRVMWLLSARGLRTILRGLLRPTREGFAGESRWWAFLRGQARRLHLLLRGRLGLRAPE